MLKEHESFYGWKEIQKHHKSIILYDIAYYIPVGWWQDRTELGDWFNPIHKQIIQTASVCSLYCDIEWLHKSNSSHMDYFCFLVFAYFIKCKILSSFFCIFF